MWVELEDQEPKPKGKWVEADLLTPKEPIEEMPVPLGGFDFGQGQLPSKFTESHSRAVIGALKQAPYKTAEGLLTTMDMLGDTMRIPGLGLGAAEAETGKALKNRIYRNNALYLREEANKMTPDFEQGSSEYYTYQVASNLFQNVPWVVAGMLTGGSVIPIVSMSSVAAGNKYNDLIEEGYDPKRAKLASIGYGIAEGLGEMISFGSLMKFAKTGVAKELLEYMIKEPLSEIGTELMQMGIDVGYLDEGMSMIQFWSRIKDVAIITGITSPLLGGFGRVMGAGVNLASGRYKVGEPSITPPKNVPSSTLPSDQLLGQQVTKTTQDVTETQPGVAPDVLKVDLNDKTLTVEELQGYEAELTNLLDEETKSVESGVLTADWIQENIQGVQVLEDMGEGQFKVQLPNGMLGRVLQVGHIEIDREEALKHYSAEEIENGIAMGETVVIDDEFTIKVIGEGTELPHETYELAELVALTKEEREALRKEEPDKETRADYYQIYKNRRLEDRAKHPYFEKIMEFFGRLHDFFQRTPNTRSIYRAIERGEVWKRMAQTGETKEQYAIRNINQIREDRKWRKWEPTVTSTGKIKGAPPWVTDRKTLNSLRTLLRKFTQEGIGGRYWYEESTRQVMKMVENDIIKAEKFIQLLAIYLPNSNVWVNTIQAVKAYTHWQSGKKEETFKVGSAKTDAKATALLYRGEAWEGRKTNSFYENLMHELIVNYPSEIGKLNLDKDLLDTISTPVTVDVWMYRSFGYERHQGGNDTKEGKYTFMESSIRRLTAEINENLSPGEDRWTPHQVQAAIWTSLKTRYELKEVKDKTNRKSEREHIIHKEGKKYVYPAKNTDESRIHMANWRHFAMQPTSEAVREAVEEYSRSFSDDLERMTEVVTWEANPSKSLKLEINNASPEVLQDFTSEARSLLMDENGNDLLATQLGVAISYSANGFGAYSGGINPNSLAHLLPAREIGQVGFNTDEVKSYARAIQYIYKQDAVPWFRPDNKALSKSGEVERQFRVIKVDTGRVVNNGRFDTQEEAEDFAKQKGEGFEIRGGNLARAIVIRFTDPLNSAMLNNILGSMQEYLGEDTGFTRTAENEIIIINFRDDETKVPYTDDEKFADAVASFIENNGSQFNINDHFNIWSEGEYGYVHDWSEDKEGSRILNQVGLSGRPDLHSWLRGRRDVFEELLDRYSGEGLKTAEQAARTKRSAYSIRSIRGSDLQVGSRYGSKQEGSTSVLGIHYSRNPRQTLTGQYHGAGLQGAERVRLADAPPEIKSRIYFYTDEGEGVRPERGLGRNITAVNLDNLYHVNEDPLGLTKQAASEGIDPNNYWFNKLEKAVYDAGFDGIYVPTTQSNQGVAVLIGPQHTEVQVDQIPEDQGKQYSIKRVKWNDFYEDKLKNMKLTDSFGNVGQAERKRWAAGADYWTLETVDPNTLEAISAPNANIENPIIVDAGGDVLDGRNRRAEAINKGEKAIAAWTGHADTSYSIKSKFREATGQTPGPKTVTEMQALNAGMTKAERAAREAFRRGVATGRSLTIQSKLATTKTRIRELTGQVRVKDLHANSLDVLEDALAMAESVSKTAERVGKETGRMTEHDRMVKLQQIRDNKAKLIKEARSLKKYLEVIAKKVDKIKMEPEYRDIVKIVATQWDGAALEQFMLNDDTLLLDQNQIDMLKDSNKKASLKGADETTLEELRNIVSLVKQLVFQGRAFRKITQFNKKVDLDDTAEEIKTNIENNFDIMVPEPVSTKEEPVPGEEPRIEQKPSKWQKIKDMCDATFNHLIKVEYFAEMLDGYKKMGKVWTSLIRPIIDAENYGLARMIQYRKRMDQALDLIRDDLRSIVHDKYMEINGKWITKENAIMIALNTIHPDNIRQLVYGNRFSQKDIGRIISTLTPNERQFVVEILDIINSQRDEMSEAYRDITGERMQLVEGIYFPIAVSRELNERIQEADKIKNLLVDVVSRASVNRAMTITRLANTKNAVKLTFDVITDHLAATNLFITHGEAIRDVSKLLTHRDVKGAITEALGQNAYSQFQKWIKGIANPHYEALRGWDSAMGWLRRNATTAILGYSLSVALLQPSAIFSTMARLGPVKTMRGMLDFYLSGKHGEIMDQIYELSPFMYQRLGNFDLDIRRQMEEDTDPLWKSNKMKESFYWMIQFMDRMATAPTWWATYSDEMRQNGDKRVAILMADKMVRNTQGSASPKDLAEVQRGSNVRKAFVMFYTFFSAQFNEMNKSVDMVKMGIKGPQEIGKAFFWIMFMPALLSVLFKRREKLLEDDTAWWEILKGVIGYGSSMIPVLGSIVNSLTEGFAYRPTPLISIPQEAIYAAQKLGKAVTTGEDEEYYKMSKHLAMLLGYVFGLPSRQAILATDVALEYYEEGEADFGNLVYKQSKK